MYTAALLSYILCTSYVYSEETKQSAFRELIEQPTFVDKTLLIKDFIDTGDKENYNLVTCPRKLGKSVNTDMLKQFFQININSEGVIQDKRSTSAYQLFVSTSKLKIFDQADFIEQHLGEYPVIHVEFLDIVINCTAEQSLHGIATAVQRAFLPYEPIIRLAKGAENQTNFMKRIIQGELLTDEESIKKALKVLASFLYDHFGKKAIVFIDNFDTPLMNMFEHGPKLNTIYNLMDEMYYGLFQRNQHLVNHALITGVVPMVRGFFRTKVKNIRNFPFLGEHKFTKYYGLTEDEFCDLCDRFQFKTKEILQIKKYYDCDYTDDNRIPVYNTWDITQYCKFRELKSYSLDIADDIPLLVRMNKFHQLG